MLKFICFGSGSSGNCYYLYTDDGGLMIDAGIGWRTLKRYFADYGLDMSRVQALLVTHDHADHIKAAGIVSTELSVPVYTTAAVLHGIDENYCVRKKVKPGFGRTITPGETFEVCGMEVTPFHVPHDSTDNNGYFVTAQGHRFCLITDAGVVTDEMKPYINRAEYLVLESNYEREKLLTGPYPQYLKDRIMSGNGHLSNTACAVALAENASPDLRHVWLAHLSEENNHPELARKTVEQTLATFGIAAGTDFMLDVLKRKTPSEIFTLE